ncbi:MAG: hypothetical protein ACR2KO_16095 [Geodermatophilaceae bacterium]
MTNGETDTSPLVLSIGGQLRPRAIAARTRDAVNEGRPVVWLSSREADLRRVAAALDGWQAPHIGSWRLPGEGRRLTYFSATEEPAVAMSYFVQPRHRVEHVLVCSACGSVDGGWAWDAPADAPAGWRCPTCGNTAGETRKTTR